MIRRITALLLITSLFVVAIPTTIVAQERVSLLIVTASGLSEYLEPLANHRSEQGIKVRVVEIDDIPVDPLLDTRENLRNYLKNNYKNWGLSYLLIVGNNADIPQAKLHSANGIEDETGREQQPGPVYSDIYYSILTSKWDTNGNGLMGEPIDNVDIDPQIAVGRFPISSKKYVEQWVESVINYDFSDHKREALQIGAIYSFDNENGDRSNQYTDGATMHNVIWDEILSKNGFRRTRIFENDSKGIPSIVDTDRRLDRKTLLSTINENKYGFINYLAHGSKTSIMRKRWINDDNDNGWADKNEILLETILETPFTAEIDSGLVIATACSTAFVATELDSLATSFLRSGASAYIGGSAINFFMPGWRGADEGGNQTISYNITRNYVDGSTIGWSLMSSLRSYYKNFGGLGGRSKALQNVYSFILLGDPSMKLDPPKNTKHLQLTATPNSTKVTSGKTTSIEIQIGNIESIDPIRLSIEKPILGIDISFSNNEPLPGYIVKMFINTGITVKPGDYSFILKAESDGYLGTTEIRLKVIPSPESTVIQLQPEYTLVSSGNEFWLDLIIQPTKPISSIAGVLSFDPKCFDFLGYRVGKMITEDYRCPQSKPIVDTTSDSEIMFSVDRGVESYGVTSTGIAFSFCFTSKCPESLGGKCFSITSMSIESHIDDSQRKHSFTALPQSLVNVVNGFEESSGYNLDINIDRHFELNSDISTVNGNMNLSGKTTIGTLLFIEDHPISTNSNGEFETNISLLSHMNDITFLIKDEYNRQLLVRRRIEYSNYKEIAFHSNESQAWVNGDCHILDASPYITEGRTLVPIRFISDQLDFRTTWDSAEKRVDITKDNTSIKLWIGSKNAWIDDDSFILDVPPEITNDRTFVPLRFIGEALDCDISWINSTHTILVEDTR
jgi:hypothetical protein